MVDKLEPGESLRAFLVKCQDVFPGGSLCVGIDPGVTGAIGFVWTSVRGRACCVEDIPATKIELKSKNKSGNFKTRSQCNPSGIRAIMEHLKPHLDYTKLLLEECIVNFRDSKLVVQSVTSSFWVWPMYLEEIGISFETVAPRAWKSVYGVIGWDKGRILRAARRKFRGVDLHLEGHHNRAEALCLADYLADLSSGSVSGFSVTQAGSAARKKAAPKKKAAVKKKSPKKKGR